MKRLPYITATILVLLFSPIFAQSKAAKNTIFDTLSSQLSQFPFDLMEEDAGKIKVKGVVYTEEEGGSSTLTDGAGVEHLFYDGLYKKVLSIKSAGDSRDIHVARIGTARTQKAVTAAVQKYTRKKPQCHDAQKDIYAASGTKTGRTERETHCTVQFDKEFNQQMFLEFDANRILKKVSLQAWDPF